MPVVPRFIAACLLAVSVAGCASLQPRDPLQVTVAGIEPLQGQGLELRLMVKLRVQNPNDAPVEFDGVALRMEVQGNTFASGVSDATGSVPRFGESVITVPVTISAFRMARQAIGVMTGKGISKLDYEMTGKLSGAGMSATRFVTKGSFDLPMSAAPTTTP
jgi:LEA14-like dessication related protein